ncbi:hypothetical protein AWC18_12510 [Mycolicibacter nonchromogenicus]|uniref:Uncharacterized protein n=1 Tax=Mycolicibacter nonchromogenicus TaxID=1782 RepID=A0A1X1ZA43_MYCNO|nr:hypothetical protein AWC18_12510 [Mycolicibacter nonchromogenicus]
MHRVKRLGWSAVATLAYAAVMVVLERGMRKTGGPGIIGFELAGSAERAQEILEVWGDEGRRWARWSLWLDFGYMATYGTLALLLIERARARHGHPIALRLLPIGAVAGDAIEGVALLKALEGVDIGTNARRGRGAALVKFALLAVGLVYTVSAGVRRRS